MSLGVHSVLSPVGPLLAVTIHRRASVKPQLVVEDCRSIFQFNMSNLCDAGSLLPIAAVVLQADLETVRSAGQGRVDVTVGSAMDIFGGSLPYSEVVLWNLQQKSSS